MSQADVCLSTADGRMKVQFAYEEDRFVHRIWIDGLPAASSLDGDSEQEWPPSPPLQQLSLENLDGRDVILGVGAAGKSHFSLAVEPIDVGDTAGGLKFEWACRTKESEPDLRACYTGLSSETQIEALPTSAKTQDESGVTLRPDGGQVGPTFHWAYRIRASAPSTSSELAS